MTPYLRYSTIIPRVCRCLLASCVKQTQHPSLRPLACAMFFQGGPPTCEVRQATAGSSTCKPGPVNYVKLVGSRTLLWALVMDPCLLDRGLESGPCSACRFPMALYLVCKDSGFAAHTTFLRGHTVDDVIPA